MYGFGHAVENVQGFGTGPGTSGSPLLSWAAVIWTVYAMQAENGTAWLRVRIVSVGFQVGVRVMAGVIVHTTLAVSIGSLNVTVMFAVRGTPTDPSYGSVATMYGFAHAVVNVQGFGTGPGTSGPPERSVPLTRIQNIVHGGKGVAWVKFTAVSPSHTGVRATAGAIVTVTDEVFIGSLNIT
jgi:hypothetical protein